MAFEVNQHVQRLRAFQPSGASGGQLLAEKSDTRPSDELTTQAHQFVAEAIERPTTRVVVLTGDAGHGKTHLCGRLITRHTGVEDVRPLLRDSADGTVDLAQLPSGKTLRVIKDLSDFAPAERGADRLVDAVCEESVVTVVCANEGRLRQTITLRREELRPIERALHAVLSNGATDVGEGIHVVDLNHQSVAGARDDSLIRQLLRAWVSDQRKWQVCDRCDAQPACPIHENRRLLSETSARGESRRSATEALLRIVEQTGHVVTIRELLIFLAHAITGGLDCRDVHGRARRTTHDWQHSFMFHQTVFGDRLESNEKNRLRVFAATRMFDPGAIAIRAVDDALVPEVADDVGRYLPAYASPDSATPRTHKALQQEAVRHKSLMRFLRRRAYFDALSDELTTPVGFAERLGFDHYRDFSHLLSPGLGDAEKVAVRDAVLAGLEAIQGARRRPGQATFLVVDPAFSSHRGAASVVAHQVTKKDIRLLPQSEWWEMVTGARPDIDRAVDWLDRRVFVVLPAAGDGGGEHPVAVELDCRQFEFVMRAASGLVSREFFQAEIRRVMSELALVAQTAVGIDTTEITVLIAGERRKLVIDVDNVIVGAEV